MVYLCDTIHSVCHNESCETEDCQAAPAFEVLSSPNALLNCLLDSGKFSDFQILSWLFFSPFIRKMKPC